MGISCTPPCQLTAVLEKKENGLKSRVVQLNATQVRHALSSRCSSELHSSLSAQLNEDLTIQRSGSLDHYQHPGVYWIRYDKA